MIKDFYYPSCGAGKIRARYWQPDMEPCGVVQIVHGIAEHIERYNDFAAYLNAAGYLVVAQDHMGHGKSADSTPERGYFYGGWFSAVDDTYQLLSDTIKNYPNIPYVLFGHSMGSFIVRSILARYPQSGIAGCIICGTAWMPNAVISMGKSTAQMVCKLGGDKKSSNLLQKLMFGNYNNRIEHQRTEFDWLTRDSKVVDAYVADQSCGFIASAGLAHSMLSGIQYIQKPDTLSSMDPKLPVLFVAGDADPVGNYGTGVKQAVAAFRSAGMQHVSSKLYPLCRHEILNELNKDEVYRDILNWISNI